MWPSVITHTIWICTKWWHLHVTISNNTHNLNMHKMMAFTYDHLHVITHTIWICTKWGHLHVTISNNTHNLNMHKMRAFTCDISEYAQNEGIYMWISNNAHTQSEYAQNEGIYMWPSVITHTIWICTKWGHLHVTISNNTHNLNMHKMRAFTCDHQ